MALRRISLLSDSYANCVPLTTHMLRFNRFDNREMVANWGMGAGAFLRNSMIILYFCLSRAEKQ